MLVLTRKLLEKVYIGDDICVTVVRLEGGQVRLGIEAPRQISVVRAELRSFAEAPDCPQVPVASEPPRPLASRFRNCQPVLHGTGIRRRVPSR
ncbi:MAG: hypothetical protein JWN86_1798 [Planctomycetota bacterium]|nr:hypothetical protein [Planctomycetota bacterium]